MEIKGQVINYGKSDFKDLCFLRKRRKERGERQNTASLQYLKILIEEIPNNYLFFAWRIHKGGTYLNMEQFKL